MPVTVAGGAGPGHRVELKYHVRAGGGYPELGRGGIMRVTMAMGKAKGSCTARRSCIGLWLAVAAVL
jgi:hypothetical protein